MPGRTRAMAMIMPPISWIKRFRKPSLARNRSEGIEDMDNTIRIPANMQMICVRFRDWIFAFLYKKGIPASIIKTNITLTMVPYLGLSRSEVTKRANNTKPMQADITNCSRKGRYFLGFFISPFMDVINSS